MLAVTDIRLSSKCRTALIKHGFSILSLPPFSKLDKKVASHPDMLILPLGDRLFVHKEYYAEAKKEIDAILSASSLSLTLTDDTVGATYPFDISLNIAVSGHFLFGRLPHMANAVIKYAKETNRQIRDINQGYAKCSTVTLGDQAIITADPTMEAAAQANSLPVLRIEEGHVILDGYDHGFIGGASGVYKSTVFFSGDLLSHPNGSEITRFCQEHGFKVISLSNELLYDVGTIFFL